MVYSLVWIAIFLIPFMNAQLMSEDYIDFNKVVISWGKIAPYFVIFITNNIILGKDSITFLYNRYEIAPYALGDIEISLDYNTLKDIMK